jgi:carbon monoxide dehydrogenase subunit G
MKWDSWDPDVERMEDIDESSVLKEGATATFVMEKSSGGSKFPIVAVDVEENKAFTFKGGQLGGMVKVLGIIVLEEKGENETLVKYTFTMMGLVGTVVAALNSKAIVGGTEGGLANIVKLSEEAQQKMDGVDK